MLEGEGDLLLWEADGVVEHPVRRGIRRRAAGRDGRGARVPRRRRGLAVLMYGTRDPNDICYYPRSGKVYFTGLGVIARLGEPLDYWDGEE